MSVTVMDGGFGTLLARYLGSAVVDTDPLWSARSLADNPQLIIQAHLEFAKAGAQLIRTNSYQASVEGFQKYLNLDEEASLNLIKTSVELARQAITEFITYQLEQDDFMPPPLMVGSVGPYGACLHDGSEYTGDYASKMTEEQLMDWHRPRIKALSEAGVRILAIETIPAVIEAKAVLKLLKTEFPNLRAWLSFSCKDNLHISEGTSFAIAATECWKLGSKQLEAVGVNCLNPAWVTSLLQSAQKIIPNIPLIAYPNSGEIWKSGVGWEKNSSAKAVASYIPEWLKLGVRYVGGCCRTYPEDIREIMKEVKKNTVR